MTDIIATTRAEARMLGLTRYNTGKPCKSGHLAPRRVANASCVICQNLWIAKWCRDHPTKIRKIRRRYTEKLSPEQLASRNLVTIKWRAKNPDKAIQSTQRWAAKNPDRIRSNAKKYRAENGEEMREKQRVWSRTNKLHCLEYRRMYRGENSTNIATYMREYRKRTADRVALVKQVWLARNPGFRVAAEAKRRARKRGVGGSYTAAQLNELAKWQKHRCAYCRKSILKGRHADHIQPISLGGSNDISNIQLLCPTCNLRKGAKDPINFAQKLGLLL